MVQTHTCTAYGVRIPCHNISYVEVPRSSPSLASLKSRRVTLPKCRGDGHPLLSGAATGCHSWGDCQLFIPVAGHCASALRSHCNLSTPYVVRLGLEITNIMSDTKEPRAAVWWNTRLKAVVRGVPRAAASSGASRQHRASRTL